MLESTAVVTLDGCPLRDFADAKKSACSNIVIRISSLIVFMHVCAGAKATIVPRSVGMNFYYVDYVV
jgi:hypothetical protein